LFFSFYFLHVMTRTILTSTSESVIKAKCMQCEICCYSSAVYQPPSASEGSN
jgi:hypothetical protein